MKYLNILERKLIKVALCTRLLVIVIQFFGNILIPDHNAGVFLYPKQNLTYSFLDSLIQLVFGGFIRWDAQYFVHIIKYGYIYENTLAFFPAFPFVIKYLVLPIFNTFPYLNQDSACILSCLFVNCVFFIVATLLLFRLTSLILNKDLAYKSAVLFCINPATVFFVAPYTECLFSFLSFYAMLNYAKLKQQLNRNSDMRIKLKYILYLFPIGLSTCARSNGILNLGFILYFFLFAGSRLFFDKFKKFSLIVLRLIPYIFWCIVAVVISISPFICLQMYHYELFCKCFDISLPKFLVEFAEKNNYYLPGKFSLYNQTWCFKRIPLAYSYVQEHYWNVGFLNYYELKQIPNFLLAFPLIFIVIKNSLIFFSQHKHYCIYLGLIKSERKKELDEFNPEMFVFIIHAFLLTLFCMLFVHIQVTTRMLCSASPVPYWFSAYYFKNVAENDPELFVRILIKNVPLKKAQKFVKYFFLSYFIIGTVMFCNFLPWT